METSRGSDTIDLSKTIVQIIHLLVQNIGAIIILLTICCGGGLLYYLLAPKVFESKMIIQSDILSESYSLKLAENLNAHIRDKDLEFLAERLAVAPDVAYQLKDFKIVSALSPMSQQMAEKEKIIIVISIRVLDNAVLPELQEGIIHYFSSNEYIKKRVDENRRKFEGLIYELDLEIKRLDTLKNKLSSGALSSTKTGGVSIIDASGLYAVAAMLHEKRHGFIVDLATVDSIQVIEGFTPYGKAVWPKLTIVLATTFIAAVMFLFIFISYKQTSKKS